MRSLAELQAHLEHIRAAPRDSGVVEMIVRRPEKEARDIVEEAQLDVTVGLVGDNWSTRGSKRTPDGSAHPQQQLTLMMTRAIAALAERERWPLAGDQFLVDFNLSQANLPAGTQLALGEAIIEISELPHTGCEKFSTRFGSDAMKWVNSGLGRELRLRGVNARVIHGGVVRRGSSLRRV